MGDKEQNAPTGEIKPEKTIEESTYDEIVEATVPDLFQKLKVMPRDSRLNVVSSYLLANALSNKSEIKNEDTKLEFLKEYGRNERAMSAEGGGSKDDDDPLFGRG